MGADGSGEVPTLGEGQGIRCPMCGMENTSDAVFCANRACHKALGEFDYVLEELEAAARGFEKLADRVAGFVGKPHFLAIHALWFSLWVAINTGVIVFVRRFDESPFGLLGILLAMEAVLMTGFLLISQNRQNTFSNKRAELDYEVNVRTYRKIREMDAEMKRVTERLDRLEVAVREDRGE